MKPDYATITVETVLSTGATTLSFDGDISPSETELLPVLNEVAEDMWRVSQSLGSVVIGGTQYTTLLLTRPGQDILNALGHTWR